MIGGFRDLRTWRNVLVLRGSHLDFPMDPKIAPWMPSMQGFPEDIPVSGYTKGSLVSQAFTLHSAVTPSLQKLLKYILEFIRIIRDS